MSDEEVPRKRKLNVFDFLKGDTETLPTTVVAAADDDTPTPHHTIKRTRLETHADYNEHDPIEVNVDSNSDDPKPQTFGLTFNAPPMAFNKASDAPIHTATTTEPDDDEISSSPKGTEGPKLTYSEVETLLDSNSSRTGFNNFKGKKYGLGAALLEKMGWVPGKGLGANLQGITEPIEMGVHRQGSGIGASLDKEKRKLKNKKLGKMAPEDYSDEESSDEEYYKEVPKKSLYQLIVEIESLGVVKVPDSIKALSNSHSSKAKKTFIELRKEGGNEDIEEVTTALDKLYNDLSNVVASRKMAEFEQKEFMRRHEQNLNRSQTYKSLQERLVSIEAIIQNTLISPMEILSQLRKDTSSNYDFYTEVSNKLQEHDITKTLILALKPALSLLFEQWDPFDINDTSLVDELTLWKSALPPLTEHYGELNYFQSLLHTLWYPTVTSVFDDWPVSQPNLTLTLVLDWEAVLDSSIIEHFIRQQIQPKIEKEIEDWNIMIPVENPPYVWIFEWLPFIHNTMEIKRQFSSKYDSILSDWRLEMGEIPGIKGYKELIGDEAFQISLDKRVFPRLVEVIFNMEFRFDIVDYDEVSECNLHNLTLWSQYFDHGTFLKLLQQTVLNNWLGCLFESIRKCQKTNTGFKKMALSIQLWTEYLMRTFPEFKSNITDSITLGLEMINHFIDMGSLVAVHLSYSKEEVLNLIKVSGPSSSQQQQTRPQGIPIHKLNVSFKEVVEQYCSTHNLFLSSQKGDLSTGRSLFKISRSVGGKGGLTGFIEEDVLFIATHGDKFVPISLDSLENSVIG